MPSLAKEDVFLFFSFSFFFRSRPVPVRPPATVSASFPRPLAPRQCPAKGTLSSFPAATQRHTPGGLKREERMFSQCWGPEVRNRGVVRSRSLLNPAGKSPPRPRLSRLRGSPAGLGFGPRRADLGLCGHVAIFPMAAGLCLVPPFIRTPVALVEDPPSSGMTVLTDHIRNDCISREGHIPRHEALGLRHVLLFGGDGRG